MKCRIVPRSSTAQTFTAELLKSGQLEEQLGMPLTPDRFDVFLPGSPMMIDPILKEIDGRWRVYDLYLCAAWAFGVRGNLRSIIADP